MHLMAGGPIHMAFQNPRHIPWSGIVVVQARHATSEKSTRFPLICICWKHGCRHGKGDKDLKGCKSPVPLLLLSYIGNSGSCFNEFVI